MPPGAFQSQRTPNQSQGKANSGKRLATRKLDDQQPGSSSSSRPRLNPLKAFTNITPPPSAPQSKSSRAKGKEKAREIEPVELDSQLWVDRYEPTSEGELAVHKRKVDDVRNWLEEAFVGGPSGKLRKYRRVLALTGPAGTAKTATVRVLSNEMGFEIMEWRNSMTDGRAASTSFGSTETDFQTQLSKFQDFLTRASSCHNVFSNAHKRRIVLLEELPNILHRETREIFQSVLQNYLDSSQAIGVPLVVIISDAGVRGESEDNRGWSDRRDSIVDLRTVFPKEMLQSPYVQEMRFNPIAYTLLKKALQALLAKTHTKCTSAAMLEIVVESANGDIRSAVMALQLASVKDSIYKSSKKKEEGNALVLESITRREQSLVLFHLMGKILYAKRKGDPASSSATKKDIEREKELDRKLKDPPKCPIWMSEHDRKASRVDVDAIYADSPIDSSLLSLYIHQNYIPFCEDMDNLEGISDTLSWVDSSGGEQWYQTNPHAFHLLSMGTMHHLPSPVPRNGQKVFKPEFFDFRKKELNAMDGVRDVRDWIGLGWTPEMIATELGGVLKLPLSSSRGVKAPPSHRAFSHVPWVRPIRDAVLNGEQLDSSNMGMGVEDLDEDDIHLMQGEPASKATTEGGWLKSDDIEDF